MMAINELGIDGVAYLSVHMSNECAYPQCVNIAIPMIQKNPSDKYSDQLQYFTLTEPICPICFSKCKDLSNNIQHPTESHVKQFYSGSPFARIMFDGEYECYQNSAFESADDILLTKPHIPCPI